MSAVPIRRHYAADEPDDIAVTLPTGVTVLIIFALALLLWAAIWFGITWTIGVLLP